MKVSLKKIKNKDKLLICIGLIIISVLLFFFRFPNAILRLIDSFIDLWYSVCYYVVNVLDLPFNINVTVLDYGRIKFDSIFGLPETFEEFKILWSKYWSIFATTENFKEDFGLEVLITSGDDDGAIVADNTTIRIFAPSFS